MPRRFEAPTLADTQALAARLAAHLRAGDVVFLRGDLGAGKTAFAAGVLRALGHVGAVKSPTFTLVEPYELAAATLYHFDLYRLQDAGELELLGVRDYFAGEAVCLVEWPERGAGVLPPPDIDVGIVSNGERRTLNMTAMSPRGEAVLQLLR